MTLAIAILPECFVSTFEVGEGWSRQWKMAVQNLWKLDMPHIETIIFSLN